MIRRTWRAWLGGSGQSPSELPFETWLFLYLAGVPITRALLLGVYIGPLDFWKLLYASTSDVSMEVTPTATRVLGVDVRQV